MTAKSCMFRVLLLMALLPILVVGIAPRAIAQDTPPQAVQPQFWQPTNAPAQAVHTQDQLFAEAEKTTTRIVPIEYANTGDLMNVLQLFGVQVIPIDKPKAVALSGAESAVELAEDAVRQLDVPPPPVKNVEVIVYLIVATKGGDIPEGFEPCGPQLEPVMEQLRSVFGFEQFGLIDTLLMRGRDGSSVEASGFLPLVAGDASGAEDPSNYQVEVRELRVQSAPDRPARFSLNGFTFGTDVPFSAGTQRGPNGQVFRQVQRRNVGISADLDVQESQMAVVGKANLSAQGDVVFVVVTAHVVPE